MSSTSFDAVARRAAVAISRRATVMTVGGAGLAAALGVPFTAARKSGKKRKKKNACQRQVGQCRGFFTNVCGSETGCPEAFACCELLANCNSGGFVACIGDLDT
jgi:hypothetical protein